MTAAAGSFSKSPDSPRFPTPPFARVPGEKVTLDQVKAAAEALGFDPHGVSQLRITPDEVWAETWNGQFPIRPEWRRWEVTA